MILLNDILEISSITVYPQRNDEVEGIGSGQILTAELATPLWSVEIDTPLSLFDVGRQLRAQLNSLTVPGAVFEVYDPIASYPFYDPDGSVLGASVVRIDTVAGDGTITLKGLPNGYKLTPGDFMQIDYAGRRYFYEVSVAATADSGGITTVFPVFPIFPSTIPANTPVTLLQPKIKCQLVPGELEYGTADSANWKMSGFRIKAVQKL